MKLKVLTESKKKNTYKIYYISKSTDLTTSAIIHAYSEKQAELLLRKVSNDIYHIVRIECIEDHSNDDNDGEQISLFEDILTEAEWYKTKDKFDNPLYVFDNSYDGAKAQLAKIPDYEGASLTSLGRVLNNYSSIPPNQIVTKVHRQLRKDAHYQKDADISNDSNHSFKKDAYKYYFHHINGHEGDNDSSNIIVIPYKPNSALNLDDAKYLHGALHFLGSTIKPGSTRSANILLFNGTNWVPHTLDITIR